MYPRGWFHDWFWYPMTAIYNGKKENQSAEHCKFNQGSNSCIVVCIYRITCSCILIKVKKLLLRLYQDFDITVWYAKHHQALIADLSK